MLPITMKHLLPDEFAKDAPKERLATCDNCVMCSKGGRKEGWQGYNSATKCCTYHPTLRNFLVGAILADSDASAIEGQKRIRAKIKDRLGVFPIGIAPVRKYQLLYESAKRSFGRAESAVCPYYESQIGGCSIWKHRNAVCATWFCVYENGFDGRLYWAAVRDYLEFAEMILARSVLLQLGWSADSIRAMESNEKVELDENDLDERPLEESAYQSIWQRWVGDEAEFYKKTHEIVSSYTQRDLEQLGGFELELRAKSVRCRGIAVNRNEVPDNLILSEDAVLRRQPDGLFELSTCNFKYTTRVSSDLSRALLLFDGNHSTTVAVHLARKQFEVDITIEMLRLLHQQRVLLDLNESYWEKKTRLSPKHVESGDL